MTRSEVVTVDDRQKDEVEGWWISLAERLGVDERCRAFFHHARRRRTLDRVHHLGGQADYVLFVLTRYWLPVVLPPVGRERYTKNEPDYWLESQQILKSAVLRLRELKPLIELLTAQSPVGGVPSADVAPSAVEVDLARMLEGIAEVAGSYGGRTIRPSSNDSIRFRCDRPSPSNITRSTAPNSGLCSCYASICGRWESARIGIGQSSRRWLRRRTSCSPLDNRTAPTS